MKDTWHTAEPIRVRLTADQRELIVRLLHDATEDLMFMGRDMEGVEEMERFGPTGVRIRDLKRMDRDIALDILDKVDYEGSMDDYMAYLKYFCDGPYERPVPPEPIPMGPVS